MSVKTPNGLCLLDDPSAVQFCPPLSGFAHLQDWKSCCKPREEGRQFFLSPGQGGDDLGIPADLNWPGRASVTTFVDAYGLVKEIPADCLAAPGYRLEHTLTTGVVTETVTVEVGSEYQIVIAGDAGAQVVCSGAITGTITADGAQRWTFAGDGSPKTATTTSLVLTVTGTLTELGVYPVTGRSNQNPPEYVSVGVESAPMYHGAGVDGYKYFSTTNGNTVNPDGSINEAVGAALPGPLRLRLEPTRTPFVLWNRDLTQQLPWRLNPGNNVDTTLAVDQVGIDGIPNSATGITVGTVTGTYANYYQRITCVAGSTNAVVSYMKKEAGFHQAFGIFYNDDLAQRYVVQVDLIDGSVAEIVTHSSIYGYEIKSVGDFWKVAIHAKDDWASTRYGINVYSKKTSPANELVSGVTVIDGVSAFADMMADQVINESTIFTEATADPRAEDAPLPWPLTTPQAEGMAVFEGEQSPLKEGLSFGYVTFSTLATRGAIVKQSSSFDLAVHDGTRGVPVDGSAIVSGESIVIASRWSGAEMQIGLYRAGAWTWSIVDIYDGAFISSNIVNILSGIIAPFFINAVSVYDEDRGRDFIEGNWS